MRDTDYMIEKGLDAGRTVTSIYALSEKLSEKELGRLLGGDELTEATLLNAREMKQMAYEKKAGLKT